MSGRKRTETDKNGQKRTETDRNGRKRTTPIPLVVTLCSDKESPRRPTGQPDTRAGQPNTDTAQPNTGCLQALQRVNKF